MIKVEFDDKQFVKDLKNIMDYSVGFLEGAQSGKQKFLDNLGASLQDTVAEFIDSMAAVDPDSLSHVYEWYMNASPAARLFDIDYTVSNLGLSMKSSFRQSTSIKSGSGVPFYDKAKIMENGIPVRIVPKTAKALVFEDGPETVFTKGPVNVKNPGGTAAQGGFEKAFNVFFRSYFSQVFLKSSGLYDMLSKPELYKKNLPAGKMRGRIEGVNTGFRWIANAGVVR